MSEKRVAPPDGGSGDLVLIQRHLENLSAGEILEELDARMEEMTDQSCDPELIRLYLDVLEEKEPLGLELDPEASLQRFLEDVYKRQPLPCWPSGCGIWSGAVEKIKAFLIRSL